MKVFLTGASGYIGKHVALELVSRGHDVVGMARKASERTEYSKDVEWCYSDLSNFEQFWPLLESSDAVVHCAMDYSSSGSENSDLDAAFVSKMRTFNGHFVYTGNLFSDRQEGDITLKEALRPNSTNWRYQSEVNVLKTSNAASIIRLGFVYGGVGGYFWEILSPGTVSELEIASIPKANWPMVHVRDVATLYASVLESGATGVFHAFDGMQNQAPEIIKIAHSTYVAHGVSSAEVRDYIQGLLKSSVLTSNERSLSTGWLPVYRSFREVAEESFAEFIDRTA